jgi:hypothetical protein
MENTRFKLLLLFFFLTVVVSCNKKSADDNKCISYAKAPVTKIEGATSTLVNQEIALTVSFTSSNGCGQFSSFEEIKAGYLTTITVNAKYEGCICTQDLPTRLITYRFKSAQLGSFNLKFWQSDNSYLTHTIVVQ